MITDRRRVLHAALALAVVAAAGGPRRSPAAGRRVLSAPLTLYDPRFPQALEAARALAGDGALLAVTGDVTALLALPRAGLQGVTTEVVPFCLQLQARLTRLDRDLFRWTPA